MKPESQVDCGEDVSQSVSRTCEGYMGVEAVLGWCEVFVLLGVRSRTLG